MLRVTIKNRSEAEFYNEDGRIYTKGRFAIHHAPSGNQLVESTRILYLDKRQGTFVDIPDGAFQNGDDAYIRDNSDALLTALEEGINSVRPLQKVDADSAGSSTVVWECSK